jgi:hypothetical protein
MSWWQVDQPMLNRIEDNIFDRLKTVDGDRDIEHSTKIKSGEIGKEFFNAETQSRAEITEEYLGFLGVVSASYSLPLSGENFCLILSGLGLDRPTNVVGACFSLT